MKFVWQGAGNLKGAPSMEDPQPAAPKQPRAAPAAPKPTVALVPPVKKEAPFVMEILSGAGRSEVKFDKPEGK
jgi:hypothetical protein